MSKRLSFEALSLDGFLLGSCYNSSSESYDSEEDGNNKVGRSSSFGKELGDGDNNNSSSSEFEFNNETTVPYSKNQPEEEHNPQEDWLSDFGIFDDMYLDIVSPPCHEEITKLAATCIRDQDKEQPPPPPPPLEQVPFPSSLGILNNFGSGFRRLSNRGNTELPTSYEECSAADGRRLSTVDILRVAGEKFIRLSSQNVDDLSMLSHHPFGSSFLGLSDEEKLDVELVRNLLASAEKIGLHRYEFARDILGQCESSVTGNPVQRLAHYFSEALRERIDRETGQKGSSGKKEHELLFDMDEAMMRPNPTIIALHKEMPYCQVSLYTAMQAIIENVAKAKKIHIIDLEIRSGIQYTVLMQALADRSRYPIELLKVTAVGTKSKGTIEKTGEWLMSFAQSMNNMPFSFDVVMVKDMSDLKRDHFQIEDDETVAVYSAFMLRTIIVKQDSLESLMKVVRSLRPCVMALIEVEGNHTSPVFVKRFIEALFFYGAYFDCLGDCLSPDNPHRNITESMYFGEGIRNIVATESDERTIRHVSVGVWRAFFARFGMTEEQLSTASIYQAELLAKNFTCWNSCTFAMDDKSLTVGWKGVPLVSISAWKFVQWDLEQC